MSEIFITPNGRRKGCGKMLVKKAIGWFKENCLDWYTVSTHSLDKEAISFWESMGFKEYNKFFKMKA